MQLMEEALPVPEQLFGLSSACQNRVALHSENREITYVDFLQAVTHFSNYLGGLGVTQGSTVAICLERSFEWIIAAAGVLHAGGVYVPLDSSWPDSRLQFAIEDSGAMALVAPSAVLARLQLGIVGIDPQSDSESIAASPAREVKAIDPESLAYVMYTSGSTGVPKGVEITHGNLAHLVRWHRDAFDVGGEDRVSHLAGLGFDAAAWEIWSSLTAGATLCLAEEEVRSSATQMREWIVREQITIGFVPTVHAMQLMTMEWPEETALRLMLTGGDVLQRGPDTGLPFGVVNNYGPTECTVVATSCVLHPGSGDIPPIGHAIAGTAIYLLDDRGQPVEDGEVGEIHIGGAGVGRGYRNLPEATSRSFVADPFVSFLQADSLDSPSNRRRPRMYRSGDLGRKTPGGEIEFRGRADRQVKIRGQRVELDEISSALLRHPSVGSATINLLADADERRIVAYVVIGADSPVSKEDLQEHLAVSLPDYMIPAHFVSLKELPLSANGKIDFQALPYPCAENSLAQRFDRRPSDLDVSNAIEIKLLSVVRSLLRDSGISRNDNFFLAGGHSLLGMQLLMQIQTAFGLKVSLRQLFDAPTVKQLAVLLEGMLLESIDLMTEEEAEMQLGE